MRYTKESTPYEIRFPEMKQKKIAVLSRMMKKAVAYQNYEVERAKEEREKQRTSPCLPGRLLEMKRTTGRVALTTGMKNFIRSFAP